MGGTFEGFEHGAISMSVHAQGTGGAWQRSDLDTGMLKWSQGNGGFNSFCTELTQTVNQGSYVEYNTATLGSAPDPNDARFPHLEGGMGTFRAGLIQDLHNKYGSMITNSVASAAFQIAVWAIVYETDSSQIVDSGGEDGVESAYYGIDIHTGSFTLRDLGADGSERTQVANMANTWLASLNSVAVSSLLALTNSDRQDQVIVIPLPAPVLMAGLGLLAIPLMRRRLLRV